MKTDQKHHTANDGTVSELVRAHGFRRPCWRRLFNAKLYNYFDNAASNMKHWLGRAAWLSKTGLTIQPIPDEANKCPQTPHCFRRRMPIRRYVT